VQETFSDISRDTTLSHAYLDKLKSIYTSPAYQDSIESHPLREKKLKKEIIDAWIPAMRALLGQQWNTALRAKNSCFQLIFFSLPDVRRVKTSRARAPPMAFVTVERCRMT
jgi:hypothetical protein